MGGLRDRSHSWGIQAFMCSQQPGWGRVHPRRGTAGTPGPQARLRGCCRALSSLRPVAVPPPAPQLCLHLQRCPGVSEWKGARGGQEAR